MSVVTLSAGFHRPALQAALAGGVLGFAGLALYVAGNFVAYGTGFASGTHGVVERHADTAAYLILILGPLSACFGAMLAYSSSQFTANSALRS